MGTREDSHIPVVRVVFADLKEVKVTATAPPVAVVLSSIQQELGEGQLNQVTLRGQDVLRAHNSC